jgi:hypothetical protein
MMAKLTTLTHKITIQLHLVAERCAICSSRSRQVRKLLDTPSYFWFGDCILYSSVSQPPGRGPVPGPGISDR